MGGQLTISIEIELGWRRGSRPHISENRRKETETLSRLLDTCDDLGIPLSFDVVGHLFHESCSGEHEGPHDADWFDIDPGTTVSDAPAFYAPDLIRSIDRASVDHEICTHTYSHLPLASVSERALWWELDHVNHVHNEFGLSSPVSLVSPKHETPRLDVLSDSSIRVVREPYREHDSTKVSPYRSYPTLTDLTREKGIAVTPCTVYPSLTSHTLPTGKTAPHRVYATLPISLRQWVHTRWLLNGVNHAASVDKPIHYWTHLYNMSNEEQFGAIKMFLEKVSEYDDSGKIEFSTMEELRDDPN